MIKYTKKDVQIMTLLVTIVIFLFLDIKFNNIIKDFYSKKFYINNTEYNSLSNLNNSEIKNNYMIFISKKYFNRNLILNPVENLTQENSNSNSNDNLNQEKSNQKANKKFNKNEWKIIIPNINLNTKIAEGTDSSVINKSVGHFSSTSKWDGNVGLAAHNSGKKSNYFERLKELSINDLIYYETANGIRKYRVIINEIIQETDWSFLKNTEDNRITLITCVKNMPEYRRCVQAIQVQ